MEKIAAQARWLLLGGMAVLFAFQWVHVWQIGQLPISDFRALLKLLPPLVEQLAPIPYSQLATPLGRIAVVYNQPLVVLVVSAWGIARGSDAVSGELGRGTMEMLLAQPVRRITVLAAQASVTLGGAATLALSAWLGTIVGLSHVQLEEPVSPLALLPAVLNLFALRRS